MTEKHFKSFKDGNQQHGSSLFYKAAGLVSRRVDTFEHYMNNIEADEELLNLSEEHYLGAEEYEDQRKNLEQEHEKKDELSSKTPEYSEKDAAEDGNLEKGKIEYKTIYTNILEKLYGIYKKTRKQG
ncbi:MAG: hypothetical protein AB1420_07070 [Bacillota bacterium]